MNPKTWVAFLGDILKSMNQIQRYTIDFSRDTLTKYRRTFDAVV